jgi:hypothetical protein
MANKRIKDLAATATSPAGDDFIALDGDSNNTRKLAADSLLLEAPVDGDLYGREDGVWDFAASPDDVPLTPTFVYNSDIGDTEFIVGDIPSSWQGYNTDLTQLSIGTSATSIGSDAFYNCSGFTGNLVIPNSVTSIGSDAFRGCTDLTKLSIGNSVTSIGSGAFQFCSGFTGNLVIPNSVTSIGSIAFYRCTGFTGNLVIPNSVTSIGSFAFYDCSSLTAAYLNQPIGQIGSNAFYYSGIANVFIGPDATGYTLGAGQTIGNKSGITVSVWTNYPNVP